MTLERDGMGRQHRVIMRDVVAIVVVAVVIKRHRGDDVSEHVQRGTGLVPAAGRGLVGISISSLSLVHLLMIKMLTVARTLHTRFAAARVEKA